MLVTWHEDRACRRIVLSFLSFSLRTDCPSHLFGQLLAFWVFVEGIPRTPAKGPCVLLVDSFPVLLDSLVSHAVTSQSRVMQAVFVWMGVILTLNPTVNRLRVLPMSGKKWWLSVKLVISLIPLTMVIMLTALKTKVLLVGLLHVNTKSKMCKFKTFRHKRILTNLSACRTVWLSWLFLIASSG